MTTDIAALTALWQQAFGDEQAFIDRFFTTGFSPDRCNCLHRQGQLAAALYWFDCQWEGKRLAYIYGVATDRRFRGQGLCRELMELTHQQLAGLGYAGTVLVPAEPGLYAMYEKMGYRGFCHMEKQTVLPGVRTVPVRAVDWREYGGLRQRCLPENAIEQGGKTLEFLGTYARFYAFDGGVFCAAEENGTLYIQEFLGERQQLAGILRTLGADKASVRLPGGDQPFAMYRSLTGDDGLPGYLGIALD